MQTWIEKSLAVVAIALMALSCSTDPNRISGPLFAETVQILHEMEMEADSYVKVYALYEQALERVELILSQHAQSPIAMGLATGQPILAGLTLHDFREYRFFLKLLAEAEQQPLAGALAIATTIPDNAERAWALYEIAQQYAKTGRMEQADKTIMLIEEPVNRTWAWTRIAGKLVETGQEDSAAQILSQALETVRPVVFEFEKDKAMTLASIAQTYAKAGHFAQALEIASAVGLKDVQAGALSRIAGHLAAAGKTAQAVQVASRALEAAEAIANEVDKAWAQHEVAQATAGIGQRARALEIVRSIARPEVSVGSATEVAGQFARAGEIETAARILSQAVADAQAATFERGQDKAMALALIAHTYAAAGQFEQALATAGKVDAARDASMVLIDIAAHAAKAGQPERAQQLLARSLERAGAIGNAAEKSAVFQEIARAYAELGQFDQAIEAARKARPAEQARAFFAIAQAYAQARQYERALEMVQHIGSPETEIAALVEIAGRMFETGAGEPAVQLLSRALVTARTIEAPGSKAWVLTRVGDALARAAAQPDEKQLALLRAMVHDAYPMRMAAPDLSPGHPDDLPPDEGGGGA
jgi:tetratricopeptide (TPR) repeat protein